MDADALARELLDIYDRDCGRATMYPPRKTLQDGIAAALREVEREARREERERCAQVADRWNVTSIANGSDVGMGIASCIRALAG